MEKDQQMQQENMKAQGEANAQQTQAAAQAEMEKIDPELAKSPFIFPDDATLAKVRVFRTLTPEEETKYSEAFQAAAGN